MSNQAYWLNNPPTDITGYVLVGIVVLIVAWVIYEDWKAPLD